MKKCVITIGRQCGSGGHTIGKTVAERLGIPFYDKKLVQIVAKRSGLSAETVRREGECSSAGSLFTSVSSRGYSALHEAGKLAAVVRSNGHEDLRKVLAILSPEGGHGLHYGLAGLAGDADGKVVLRLFLQQGEDNSLMAGPLPHHGAALPMAFFHFLHTLGGDLRAV